MTRSSRVSDLLTASSSTSSRILTHHPSMKSPLLGSGGNCSSDGLFNLDGVQLQQPAGFDPGAELPVTSYFLSPRPSSAASSSSSSSSHRKSRQVFPLPSAAEIEMRMISIEPREELSGDESMHAPLIASSRKDSDSPTHEFAPVRVGRGSKPGSKLASSSVFTSRGAGGDCSMDDGNGGMHDGNGGMDDGNGGMDGQASTRQPTEEDIEGTLRKLGSSKRALSLRALREDSTGTTAPAELHWPARGLVDNDALCLSSLLNTPGRLASLASLNLAHNGLTDAGARALGRALALGAPALTKLALHENHIGCDGMTALAAAFVPGGAENLRELRLNFNHIGDRGIAALAHAWRDGGGARCCELHAVANDVGDAGLAAIAEHLHVVPLLTVLMFGSAVGGNRIGGDGAHALARALRLNAGRALAISLRGNPLSPSGIAAIRSAEHDCSAIGGLRITLDGATHGM